MFKVLLLAVLPSVSIITFEREVESLKLDPCLQGLFFKQLYSEHEKALRDLASITGKCNEDFPTKIPQTTSDYELAMSIKTLRDWSACRQDAFAKNLYSVAALQKYFRSHLPKNCNQAIRRRAKFIANTSFDLEPMLFPAPESITEERISEIIQKEK